MTAALVTIERRCAWCGLFLGTLDDPNPDARLGSVSHGCCDACLEKHFPDQEDLNP